MNSLILNIFFLLGIGVYLPYFIINFLCEYLYIPKIISTYIILLFAIIWIIYFINIFFFNKKKTTDNDLDNDLDKIRKIKNTIKTQDNNYNAILDIYQVMMYIVLFGLPFYAVVYFANHIVSTKFNIPFKSDKSILIIALIFAIITAIISTIYYNFRDKYELKLITKDLDNLLKNIGNI